MNRIFSGKVWKFGDCIDSSNIRVHLVRRPKLSWTHGSGDAQIFLASPP